jgi:hypothetical protein
MITLVWSRPVYFGHPPQVSIAFDGGRIWVATPYRIVCSVPVFVVVATVIAAGLLIPAIRFLTSRSWRDPRYPAREGRYCACGYNLAGNESGVCPECGRGGGL